MAKYFNIPFASAAAKTTLPDNDSERVSWNGGYSVFYEYDTTVGNNKARHIERDAFNTILYEITSSLQAIQLNGISPYYDAVIASTGYPEGAVVSYAGKLWRSKVNANKIKPNETTKDRWEEVLGYDTLVARLKKDGVIGNSGGGTNTGYTKAEIDSKLSIINNNFQDYRYLELGDIFLLSWCDTDRNSSGFFLCNGDKLPFTNGAVSNEKQFFGNQLYDLCYETVSGKKTETAFKKSWNIKIDESAKSITLPNVLSGVSETQHVILSMSKDSGVPDTTKLKYFSSGEVTSEAEKLGNIVYEFKLLPCIYLGNYGGDN